VNSNGNINYNDYNYNGGVRPFWWEVKNSKTGFEIRAPPSKEQITFLASAR
jgi:hypothetical protein